MFGWFRRKKDRVIIKDQRAAQKYNTIARGSPKSNIDPPDFDAPDSPASYFVPMSDSYRPDTYTPSYSHHSSSSHESSHSSSYSSSSDSGSSGGDSGGGGGGGD